MAQYIHSCLERRNLILEAIFRGLRLRLLSQGFIILWGQLKQEMLWTARTTMVVSHSLQQREAILSSGAIGGQCL